jgi:leucyl aminopeptidase
MLAFASPTPDATPVWLVSAENWPSVKSTIGEAPAAFAERCGFQPKAGRMQLLPGEAGALAGVLFGIDEANAPTRDPFAPGNLATSLPEGVYRFANAPQDADLAALGFLLALYRYDRFRVSKAPTPQLVAPDEVDAIKIQRIAEAIAFGRDLVNTPANVLGPNALEQEAVKLAERFDASVAMVRGDELIGANFPLIHVVGRAGAEEPKESPSTPAVSTSSRPRAWSS